MDKAYSNAMNEKVIKSIFDILILQFIKNKPMPKNKIVNEINSRFNVALSQASVDPALSSLQKQRLIATSKTLLILTKKGDITRKKLVRDYLRLQKVLF